MSLAIVVIGYNRVNSLRRLIDSLQIADYLGDEITLIISVDKSDNKSVEEYVKSVKWEYGELRIILHEERLGLRKHILKCGDYCLEYDAIAVLEDDIVVSKSFYRYMKSCVLKYSDDDQIAGISLYGHEENKFTSLKFEPCYSQFDVYFQQIAQSWGQIWMKKQWFEFKDWYEKNHGMLEDGQNIPSMLVNWPDNSWLKYHIYYCIVNDKYFVYPYKSLTTCFSDVGEHSDGDIIHQVRIDEFHEGDYLLPSLDNNDAIKYDVFFERIFNEEYINGINVKDICIDLYGEKQVYVGYKYSLTPLKRKNKVIDSYALCLRPHENNFLYNIKGNQLFLYDMNVIDKKGKKSKGYIGYHLKLCYGNFVSLIKRWYIIKHR